MRLLLVFLKEPVPGSVKTRLAADVGAGEAARYYKALVEVQLRQLQGLENCRIRFCYAPDDADEAIRFWLLPLLDGCRGEADGVFLSAAGGRGGKNRQEIDFRPQGHGNLGDRLERAFAEGFADGFGEVAVIGTDCPDCGARWINAGFSRMANDRLHGMIGPSTDGGYYMLGLKNHRPALFRRIAWGTDRVLEQTLAAAVGDGAALEQLPWLTDVDRLGDWENLLDSPLGPALKKALGEEPG